MLTLAICCPPYVFSKNLRSDQFSSPLKWKLFPHLAFPRGIVHCWRCGQETARLPPFLPQSCYNQQHGTKRELNHGGMKADGNGARLPARLGQSALIFPGDFLPDSWQNSHLKARFIVKQSKCRWCNYSKAIALLNQHLHHNDMLYICHTHSLFVGGLSLWSLLLSSELWRRFAGMHICSDKVCNLLTGVHLTNKERSHVVTRGLFGFLLNRLLHLASKCVCVCMCVCERERERKGDRDWLRSWKCHSIGQNTIAT